MVDHNKTHTEEQDYKVSFNFKRNTILEELENYPKSSKLTQLVKILLFMMIQKNHLI